MDAVERFCPAKPFARLRALARGSCRAFPFEPYPRSRVSNRKEDDGRNVGTIVEVKGVVIDVVFAELLPSGSAISTSRAV